MRAYLVLRVNLDTLIKDLRLKFSRALVQIMQKMNTNVVSQRRANWKSWLFYAFLYIHIFLKKFATKFRAPAITLKVKSQ